MEGRTASMLIALALAVYGGYRLLYAVTMLPVPASPFMLIAFGVQAVLAILAAIGVWRQQRFAAAALLLLGASIAVTALVEAFVLGIIARLSAILLALAAIGVALLLAAYINRSDSSPAR
jgi:hypothetical protein